MLSTIYKELDNQAQMRHRIEHAQIVASRRYTELFRI
jgi:predicted amidohydrolase YtcJ